MEPSLLSESPFTDVASQGPDNVFDIRRTDRLCEVIDEINDSAVAGGSDAAWFADMRYLTRGWSVASARALGAADCVANSFARLRVAGAQITTGGVRSGSCSSVEAAYKTTSIPGHKKECLVRKPGSVKALEDLGRVRLSKSFFMRDMLYSEISNFYGIPNIPDDPDLAVAAATRLCEDLLEPLQERLGRISIRSAYRSPAVNEFGNKNKLGCARNELNHAAHIFDMKDADGCMGATVSVVVNSFIDYYERTGNWQALAWWIHDNLPPTDLYFFPKLAAFNISWHERPGRTIQSHVKPTGYLTKPGMENFGGSHEAAYAAFLNELS